MSFASDVKNELLKLESVQPCCLTALTYGMLIFGHSFSLNEISIQTENRAFAQYYAQSVFEVTGQEPEITETAAGKFIAAVTSREARETVLAVFGYSGKEPALRINRANIKDECCALAFLRGAFLSCGTITSPQKDYHLEFSVAYKNLCSDFMAFLNESELQPKHIMRKSSRIVYFKESEQIEDLLAGIGAQVSALQIMNVKIYKDFRNKANRITNCETANITKTVDAAGAQIAAIERIRRANEFESLPSQLQELAMLRLENPEMSLRELGESLSEPLSRSGVNHRLKRLMQLADELSGSTGK